MDMDMGMHMHMHMRMHMCAGDKPGGASAGLGACDGVQGYLLAQCIGNSSVHRHMHVHVHVHRLSRV